MSEVAAPTTTAPVAATETKTSGDTPAGEAKAAVQAMREKFSYKVDGEDVEEEIDLSNKEELTKRLRLSRAAEKRMSEAKDAKSKAFDIVKQFDENPESVLRRLPPGKAREIAEKILLEQLNDEMMSPEEKTARDREAKLKKYEEQEEKSRAEQEAAEKEQAMNKYRAQFETTIVEALKKSNLPATPALVAEMARLQMKKLALGIELDADDLAAEVRKNKTSVLTALAKDATPEQLIALLGPDIANKIRKHDLAALQAKQNTVFQNRSSGSSTPSTPREDKPPQTLTEWRESLNERVK